MATTTNYAWETPDDTDLVKDGAAAIRTLGSSIDTTTKALNPSTTTGDIEYRSSTANTNNRLAIGTAGQVLTVNGGATAPEWAALPPAVSGLTLISATVCSAVSSQAITAFSSTYTNYRIVYSGNGTADQSLHMRMRDGATDSSTNYYYYANRYFSSNATNSAAVANGVEGFEVGQTFAATAGTIEVYQPFEAQRTSVHAIGQIFSTSATRSVSVWSSGVHNESTSYDGFNLRFLGGAFTGTIFVYGYQKA